MDKKITLFSQSNEIWSGGQISFCWCRSLPPGSACHRQSDLIDRDHFQSLFKKIPSEMEVAPRYKLLVSTVYTVSSVYTITVQTVFYTSEQNVWLEWMDGYPFRLFWLSEHLRCLKIRPYGKKINQDHLSLSSRKISYENKIDYCNQDFYQRFFHIITKACILYCF